MIEMVEKEMYMWMVFAHFIGDWGVPNTWITMNKGKHAIIMGAHCVMYTAVCILALKLMGFDNLNGWAAWIFLSHYCIDYWKSRNAEPDDFPTWHVYIDQAAHIGILWGVIYFGKM